MSEWYHVGPGPFDQREDHGNVRHHIRGHCSVPFGGLGYSLDLRKVLVYDDSEIMFAILTGVQEKARQID